MKVFITGGSGFLGRHLVWRFCQNHRVLFTGRNTGAIDEVYANAAKPVDSMVLDHRDSDSRQVLVELTKGASVVIHNAALSSPWGRRQQFEVANVKSTKDVVAACERNNVRRLVLISSPSVYFDYQDRANITEDHVLPRAVNHYAETKAIAEQIALNSSIEEVVVLRPRALFGPWDATLMPRLLKVMRRGTVPLIRGGEALVDLTYIDNAVDAVCLSSIRALPANRRIYNVSNAEPWPIKSLLSKVSEEFDIAVKFKPVSWFFIKNLAHVMELYSRFTPESEPLMTRYSAGVLAFGQTLDTRRIQTELGYTPQVSVTDGIRKHAEWYRSSQKNKVFEWS